MKKFVFSIILAVFAVSVSAQKLIDVYKKGPVKLVPDTEYAQGNNWDKVFRSYYDTLYGTPMGNRKSLIILPDGSVVVNHEYRNYYSKFSTNGKFEKEFGIIKSNGERVKKIKKIEGIINNNTLFTGLDNRGNMICCDFNGNYIKTLKLDYMSRQMIPVNPDKIAVVGWVIWETKFRDFVSIVDYKTNKQKIIWDHFTERCDLADHCNLFNYSYMFKGGQSFGFTTMPFSNQSGLSLPPKIEVLNNNLVVANPVTGEIRVYDTEGKLKSKEKIDWATNYLSVDEQKEIQQKAIDRMQKTRSTNFAHFATPEENTAAFDQILKDMRADLENISEPIPIPVFSTIIKDSDGNLLFFGFPKEENANKFNVWVYGQEGHFVCQSSFICTEYDLQINPSKMVFHNGYIYGLQILKKASGVPLRLVRFILTGN